VRLVTRAFIDRAKGTLALTLRIGQDKAYRMEKRGRQNMRKSMTKTAESIVSRHV